MARTLATCMFGAVVTACAPSRDRPPPRSVERAEALVPAASPVPAAPPGETRPARASLPEPPLEASTPAVEPIVEEEPASELPGVHPSLAALCTDFLNRTQARRDELKQQAESLGVALGTPSCAPRAAPVPFGGDATYVAANALVVSDGLASHSLLVARLGGGYVATSITWAWDDPSDPGCPSIVRPATVLSLHVESGRLIAVIGGETTMYVEAKAGASEAEDGVRAGLVRTVMSCKASGAELRCKTHEPPGDHGFGWKMQPHREWEKSVAWAALPWKELAPFTIDEGGELHLRGTTAQLP